MHGQQNIKKAEFMFQRLPKTWDYNSCPSAKAVLYLCGR